VARRPSRRLHGDLDGGLRLRRDLGTVIAFSGGVVVAVALFDVLPESVRSTIATTRIRPERTSELALWVRPVSAFTRWSTGWGSGLRSTSRSRPASSSFSPLSATTSPMASTLALYVGFFLFLGASDLLPEAHHEHPSRLRVALTVAGFAFIFAIVRLTTGLA